MDKVAARETIVERPKTGKIIGGIGMLKAPNSEVRVKTEPSAQPKDEITPEVSPAQAAAPQLSLAQQIANLVPSPDTFNLDLGLNLAKNPSPEIEVNINLKERGVLPRVSQIKNMVERQILDSIWLVQEQSKNLDDLEEEEARIVRGILMRQVKTITDLVAAHLRSKLKDVAGARARTATEMKIAIGTIGQRAYLKIREFREIQRDDLPMTPTEQYYEERIFVLKPEEDGEQGALPKKKRLAAA